MIHIKTIAYFILTLLAFTFVTSRGFAAPAYDLAIPTFRGQTQYPAMFKGLQRMLIDDLRAAMDRRIMSSDDIRAAIEANGLSGPIFST